MEKMPRARKSRLIVKEVDGEILIYDQERDKAHCLNPTAAKVWKYCDGETTLTQACNSLSRDLGTHVDEKLVSYAVDQFASDHLLEAEVGMPAFMIPGLNRRQMVRTLGLAAAVAVPLVTSILAPTPAQAATCDAAGTPCTDGSTCCSTVCDTGGTNQCT
jgi:hypothetical protein